MLGQSLSLIKLKKSEMGPILESNKGDGARSCFFATPMSLGVGDGAVHLVHPEQLGRVGRS